MSGASAHTPVLHRRTEGTPIVSCRPDTVPGASHIVQSPPSVCKTLFSSSHLRELGLQEAGKSGYHHM